MASPALRLNDAMIESVTCQSATLIKDGEHFLPYDSKRFYTAQPNARWAD
jgi:hypothetical protein